MREKNLQIILALSLFLLSPQVFAEVANQGANEVSFSKKQIQIGNKTLSVEIADTPARRARGLMNRKELPENHGMLFEFEESMVLKFWMKDTYIPLSIGFFDANRKLIDIQDMEPALDNKAGTKVYASRGSARYALEVPKGWFSKNKINLSSEFRFLTSP